MRHTQNKQTKIGEALRTEELLIMFPQIQSCF